MRAILILVMLSVSLAVMAFIGWISGLGFGWLFTLGTANVVRSWAALRVMTQDGFPIYDESETHPGAFTVCCHSGVTLAAKRPATR